MGGGRRVALLLARQLQTKSAQLGLADGAPSGGRAFASGRPAPDADVTIVGAGIVGLATARELLHQFPHARVTVVEKEKQIVPHQSSHNSGVIHAGIYYAPGSAMARLCVEGARMMYDYCKEKGIRHERVGKLIVATSEREVRWLDDLHRRAASNGVEGLEMLDGEQIRMLEPNVTAIKALHSPNTGIVDYKDVGEHYAKDILATGRARLQTSFTVNKIDVDPNGITVRGTDGTKVASRYLITCGGLHSDRIARMAGGAKHPYVLPFRGTYHVVKPQFSKVVKRNIYPVPDPRFSMVGVHLTPKVDGRLLIGPNAALALAREGYRFWDVNPRDVVENGLNVGLWKLVLRNLDIVLKEVYRDVSVRAFTREAQKYCPSLRPEQTEPGFSGVHAVAIDQGGNIIGDFIYENGPWSKVLHVRNAPSPAATSSLAIAKDVVGRAAKDFRWGKETFKPAKNEACEL